MASEHSDRPKALSHGYRILPPMSPNINAKQVGPWLKVWPDVIMHRLTDPRPGPRRWYLRPKPIRLAMFRLQFWTCQRRGTHRVRWTLTP